MTVLVLLGVLALVIGGCACVVWAARGGPRWARGAAVATLTAGELLRRFEKNRHRNANQSNNGVDP
ncbi:hypothetical protein ABZZ20_30395 [Streptomyces sp. NPDC006430]|uniref:hypothetical protein n=1 Tax=Streptomyces sp. NPDC006430 TaxID=3154299 RepID=UPI0033A7744A